MIKIALLTDIHAFNGNSASQKDKPPPSRIDLSKPETFPTQHPFVGLHHLISRESLTADYLMCAGDMTNQADNSGITYVWTKLQELKKKLHAPKLIATAGNHDLDSRLMATTFDAKGALQNLRPFFPGLSESFADRFWARNYAILTDPNQLRIVVLNSCAYHGYGTEKQTTAEYLNGRVSDSTRERLKMELQDQGRCKNNLLFCHHHPERNNEIDESEYSEMLGGDKLLNMLSELDLGPWIVIHGHKHSPRLRHASGGNIAPIIVSLASFSAYVQGNRPNQFYLLSIDTSLGGLAGTSCRGSIRAWDWSDALGWNVAKNSSGIPGYSGFGFRGDLSALATSISSLVEAGTEPWLTFDEIRSSIPDVEFVLPGDLKVVIKGLEALGRKVIPDEEKGLLIGQVAK